MVWLTVLIVTSSGFSVATKSSAAQQRLKPAESKLVEILEPNSSTEWYAGTQHNIKWRSLVRGAKVHRLHLYKGGQLFRWGICGPYYIFYWTSADWTIPVSIPSGDDYQIVATEETGDSVIGKSEAFTIVNVQEKSLTVTSPRASTLWAPGKIEEIAWYPTGNIQQVRIELFRNGNLEQVISEGATNTRSYWWDVPEGLAPSIGYQIRISDSVNDTIQAISDPFEVVDATIFFEIQEDTYIHHAFEMGEFDEFQWKLTSKRSSFTVVVLSDSQYEQHASLVFLYMWAGVKFYTEKLSDYSRSSEGTWQPPEEDTWHVLYINSASSTYVSIEDQVVYGKYFPWGVIVAIVASIVAPVAVGGFVARWIWRKYARYKEQESWEDDEFEDPEFVYEDRFDKEDQYR